LTLTGNPDVRFDCSSASGWSPTLIAELEDKALNGEVVGVESGSPEFALTFRLVDPVLPEPLSWSGVLPPINADGSSVFKAGRVVPLKFYLTDESAGITDLEVRLYFTKLSDTVECPVNEEAYAPGAAHSGNPGDRRIHFQLEHQRAERRTLPARTGLRRRLHPRGHRGPAVRDGLADCGPQGSELSKTASGRSDQEQVQFPQFSETDMAGRIG
jgi:hypothetical protein